MSPRTVDALAAVAITLCLYRHFDLVRPALALAARVARRVGYAAEEGTGAAVIA